MSKSYNSCNTFSGLQSLLAYSALNRWQGWTTKIRIVSLIQGISAIFARPFEIKIYT
jgi:hypothetical protein